MKFVYELHSNRYVTIMQRICIIIISYMSIKIKPFYRALFLLDLFQQEIHMIEVEANLNFYSK